MDKFQGTTYHTTLKSFQSCVKFYPEGVFNNLSAKARNPDQISLNFAQFSASETRPQRHENGIIQLPRDSKSQLI